MPTQATIAITPGTGQLLDAVSLTIGLDTVVRETMVIADPTSATQLAGVTAGGALKVDASATTQPVSISGSVPVTGTFWQATQPVSIAAPVAVTGTFWQATQPVSLASPIHAIIDSGSVTANIGTTNGLALDATLTGGTLKALPYDGANTIFTSAHPGYIQGSVTVTSTTITGTVSVTQGTSPWVVSNGGTFAVQATLADETTKVIGTIRLQGNVGGVMDTTLGSTQPSNVLQVGGNDGTNAYAVPLTSGGTAVKVSGTTTPGTSATTGNAPTAATVGVVSAEALALNAARKGVILTNTSSNYISLGFGANAAVLYSGVTLAPYGTYEMDAYNFTTAAINAIASGASSNLAIQEWQ